MHEKIHKKIKNILGAAISLHTVQEKAKLADHYQNINASLLSLVKIVAKSSDCDVIAFGLVDNNYKNVHLLHSNLLLDLVPKDCSSPAWEDRKNRHLSGFKTDLVGKVLSLTNQSNISNVEIMTDCFKRAAEPIFIKSDKKVVSVREGWRWLPSKAVRTDWYHEGVTKIIHDEEDIAFVMLSTMVLTPKNSTLTKLTQLAKHRSFPSAPRLSSGVSWRG